MFLSLTRVGIVLLASFPAAQACVCQATPTVAESFSKNTAIFTGTVLARAKYGAWLRVDKPWKGVTSRTVYLHTGSLRNDCDPWFGKKGERWLVYARLEPLFRHENSKMPYTRKLRASGCDRTTLLVHAAEDLRKLAALKLSPTLQGRNSNFNFANSSRTISFCDLSNSPIDLIKEIRVRAIYRVGLEWSELYSLKCPSAPRIWVEFSEHWEAQSKGAARKELNNDEGTFGVILSGKLVDGRGFGHMGAYPMKFEVTSVESAKRLDKRSYHSGALTPEMRRRVEQFEAKP